MRDTLSSRATFAMKFVFPTVWVVGFGASTVVTLRSARGAASHAMSGAWMLAAIWLACSAVLLWFCAPLKRVRLRNGRLLVSNFRREIEIAPADIARVTQNKWVNLRPISIHLRAPGVFGRQISFIPPSHVIIAFRQADRLVEQLDRFAQSATAEPDTAHSSLP
jgi:hypothetical protein